MSFVIATANMNELHLYINRKEDNPICNWKIRLLS
jgi:hypothetical protein